MQQRVSAQIPDGYEQWADLTRLDSGNPVAGGRYFFRIEIVLRRGMARGQSIECLLHFSSDTEFFQVERPGDNSHFSCTAPPGLLEAFVGNRTVHGPTAFFPYTRYAGFRLLQDAAVGERFVCLISDVRVQSYEEAVFNLRFAATQGDELLGYLGDVFYEIEGGRPAALRVVVPTCVEVDEPVEVKIVVCDRYDNKSAADVSGYEFEINGPVVVQYDPEKRLHVVSGIRFGSPGTYYLKAEIRGGNGIMGVSNPIVVRDKWPLRVFWGDIHQHAYYYDGRGTPAANYRYAVTTSCLDFCAITPHQSYTFEPGALFLPNMPAQEGWEELIEAAKIYNGSDLVTILGSEPKVANRWAGHLNTYYLNYENRPVLERLKGKGEPEPGIDAFKQFTDELERSSGEYLLLPHAHVGPGPANYRIPKKPGYQTNVEICSVHGTFEAYYHGWLRAGHIMGVHAGGDTHMASTGNATPGRHYTSTNGLTGAFAPAKTRRGIWDSFRHRATYAVTGHQRVFLEFSIQGAAMGSVLPVDGGPRSIRTSFAGTAPVLRVDLLKNSEILETSRPHIGSSPVMRMIWRDHVRSRRADESETTGRIIASSGEVRVVERLPCYHLSDSFVESGGGIDFKTNAYSGSPRGVIFSMSDESASLSFSVVDIRWSKVILQEEFRFLDGDTPLRIVRQLATGRPGSTPPEFVLEAEQVDIHGDKDISLEWTDDGGTEDYYMVRVEQIDGNIAWSSPIWFRA